MTRSAAIFTVRIGGVIAVIVQLQDILSWTLMKPNLIPGWPASSGGVPVH